jgi:hypothetical protein
MGRELHSRVRRFFDGPLEPGAAPIELLQAALDLLERKVQPTGRGSRIFPYNQIAVRVAQPSADRDAIGAVFAQLEPRLRERLAELRCQAPARLLTDVVVVEPDGDVPVLSVECTRVETPAPLTGPAAAPDVTVSIAVVKGQCEQPEYRFTESLVTIGRTADPVDAHGNVRRNHVVFADVRDGISETVARAHARLQRDPETGDYHLFNETSTNPTVIIRAGRSIRVPPRDPRGLRVQSGDEIQLGRAVIRLTIAMLNAEWGTRRQD